MSDPRTLRILEIDGGGERGYLSLQFLKKFVDQWGIPPEDIWKHFDVICGTSVGAIMSLALASGLTPDQMQPFFTVQGPYIFSLTSLTPSVRPNLAAKIALILSNTPFYASSGPTAEDYGAGLLYKTVQDTLGVQTLQDLKTNVIIPAYEDDTKTYVLFSNLDYPEFIGQNELASNVGLASGAAPVYLPPLVMNGHSYLDGGIYQNNPGQFGINIAKMIKPRANRFCVLSIGTGLGETGFDPGNPSMTDPRISPELMETLNNLTGPTETIEQIFSLFNIASTGGQESVALNMLLQSKYTLDQFYFYRFQPQLDPNLNTELDNTDPEILEYYDDLANEYYNNDAAAITNFLGHLMA